MSFGPNACCHLPNRRGHPKKFAIDILIRINDSPTAVLCYSNVEATLIVHAMWQYGIQIPGQVSVVGFNDGFATQYMSPPLTTIGFDATEIGKLGAELVLAELEVQADGDSNSASDGKAPSVLTIKPKLHVRGSTGPAAMQVASRTA